MAKKKKKEQLRITPIATNQSNEEIRIKPITQTITTSSLPMNSANVKQTSNVKQPSNVTAGLVTSLPNITFRNPTKEEFDKFKEENNKKKKPNLMDVWNSDVDLGNKLQYTGMALQNTGEAAKNIFTKSAMNSLEGMAKLGVDAYNATANTLKKASSEVKAEAAEMVGRKDLAKKERKSAKKYIKEKNKSSEEFAKRQLTEEFANKTGMNQRLASQEALGSMINRENLGGQVVSGVGQMIPSIALGQMIPAPTPNAQTLAELKGLDKAKYLLPYVGKTAVSPSTLSFTGSVYGNALGEALNDGANIDQARKYALLEAAKEEGTEMITGGIPGTNGVGGLDTIIESGIDKTVSKPWLNAGLKYLYNTIGEGAEESLADILEPYIKNSTYSKGNKIDWNQVLNSGVVGSLSAIPLGLGGLQSNYQQAQQNQIANQVDAFNLTPKERVQSPVVSPNSTNNVENSLQNNMQNFAVNNAEIDNNNRYQQLNDNNSQQRFYQEIKNTDSIQKQRVYQQANNKNVLNNSKETHDLVDFIANLSEYTRRDYNIVTNNELQDRYQQLREIGKNGTINGFEENGTVTINLDSEKAFNKLIGHETTHLVENTKQYKQLQETLFELAKERGEYDRKLAEVQKTYEGTNANIMNELTSDLMGDYGFTNQEFVNRLHAKNYNLFTKIHDFIKHLYNVATAGSKERKLTEQALYLFDKANESQIKNKQAESVKGINFSISDIKGQNGNYGKGVILDTNFFNGVKPRNWGKLVNKFVYNNLVGKTIDVYNQNNELEQISFAKSNERVRKDGAKNSHKVIDKLTRNNNNIKNLSVVQIDEVLQASKNIDSNKENSHQWLDTNGWNLKKIYLQTKKGGIYEALLNIAKTKDGRNILYDINKIKKVDDADVPSIKGLSRTSTFVPNNIPQNNKNVKSDTSSTNSNMQENTKYSLTEGNTSFSYNENAKRYDDLQDSTKIEFFKKDNGDIRINMLDKNNDVVNQFDVYSEVNSTRQLGENIGKYIFDNAKDTTNTIYLEENNKNTDTDYMMNHRPTETGITADNLINQNVESPMPNDVYEHPEYYGLTGENYTRETMSILNKIRNKPNADVTIYRATTGEKINKGDWVTLSKSYAEHHNESELDGKGKVVKLKVKAKDIQFAGDDLNEFGYFPKSDTNFSISDKSNQYNVLSNNNQQQNDSIVALSEAGKNTKIRLKDAPITGYTKDGAPIYRQANGVETFYLADEKTDFNPNVIVTPDEQLHMKVQNSKDNVYTMLSKESMNRVKNTGLDIIYDDVNMDYADWDKIQKKNNAGIITDIVRNTEKILEYGDIRKTSPHEATIKYSENGFKYTIKINDSDRMTNIKDFVKTKISNLPNLSISDKPLTPQTTSTEVVNNINLPKDVMESKFYKNITENSQFINEENRTKLTEEDIRFYKKVTNKESMNRALNRLDNGNMVDEITNWYSKESKNADSTDVAEGWILLKRYQDAGQYDQMVQVAKKMREIATKSGQTVQMYRLLERLTPEGMVKYAQSELSEAYEVYIKDQSKDWIDSNSDKFDLKPEETKFILDTMEEVQNMQDGYDKKVKLAQIQAMLQNKLPPANGAGIKAWMRISMLFNPKTQIRNVVGNALIAPVNMVGDTFASGVDKLISKKTGVRTTGTPKISKLVKGAGKGLYESYNDFKLGIDTRNIQGNRFEIGQGKNFKERTVIGKTLNKTDKLLSFVLDAGDRPFYEAAFVNSINNQLVLNNTTEVTQDMVDIATNEALQRTWQDNNKYTQFVLNIRRGLNNINVKGYGLGDVIIPFAKTPANLTKAIVDYSPVGLVKTLTVDASKFKKSLSNGQYTAQKQHQFVQNLGKATAGSLLYVLGYALAKAKVTGGKSDDDKDVANFMKNTLGITSYSIKIGDKSFTYDWAQPIAAPFSITADLVNNKNEKANLLEQITSTLDVPFNLILEQSFMSGLQDILTNYEGIPTGLLEQIMDLPARATPTLFKQITDMIDTTQRTTFEKGEPIQSAVNAIKAKIPTLSKDLAPTRDSLGREIKKYGGDVNPFNVFLNPANMNKGKESESAKEIYKIYKATGDNSVMPRVAPYKIDQTIDGKKYSMTLNSKQRSEFQKISGDIIEKNVKKLPSSSTYKKLSNGDKAEVINGIVDYAYNKAKSKITKKPISRNYKKIDTQVKEGFALYDVYAERVYNRR